MIRSRRRGYTIVELAVVAVISTALVAGLVSWAVSVGAVAHGTLGQSAANELLIAQAQLRDDFQHVQFCTANAVDARVRDVTADNVVLISDIDSDGVVETVGWRLLNENLERSVAEMGPDCTTGTFTEWVVWASNIDAESSFSVVAGGLIVLDGTAGLCLNEFLPRCAIDAIRTDLTQTDTLSLQTVYDVAGGRRAVTLDSLTDRLVPGRVTGLIAEPADSVVGLSWPVPRANGLAITGYVAEISDDDGATWGVAATAGSAQTTVSLGGLTNGVKYSFRVAATNENGAGAKSVPVTASPFPPGGTPVWVVRGGGVGAEQVTAVVADAAGGYAVLGGSYRSSNSSGLLVGLPGPSAADAFVSAVSPIDGALLWSVSGGGSGSDTVNGIAAHGDIILVAGSYSGTPGGFLNGLPPAAGSSDAFIAALDPTDGSTRWVLGGGSGGEDVAIGVALDPTGQRGFVVGSYSGAPSGFLLGVGSSGGGRDAFVAALDAVTGEIIWSTRTGGAGEDSAAAVTADPAGGVVYVAGSYAETPTGFAAGAGSSAGNTDVFVAALTQSSGAPLWVRRAGGVGADAATAIYADSAWVRVAGKYGGTSTGFLSALGPTAGQEDAWVASLSRAGGTLHEVARGGAAQGETSTAAVTSVAGNVFAAGRYVSTPGGFLQDIGPAAGSGDSWVTGLRGDMSLWSVRAGSASEAASERATAISATAAGWLLVVGEYHLTASGFGAGAGTSAGSSDIYVAKLSPGPLTWPS